MRTPEIVFLEVTARFIFAEIRYSFFIISEMLVGSCKNGAEPSGSKSSPAPPPTATAVPATSKKNSEADIVPSEPQSDPVSKSSENPEADCSSRTDNSIVLDASSAAQRVDLLKNCHRRVAGIRYKSLYRKGLFPPKSYFRTSQLLSFDFPQTFHQKS